MAWPVKRPLYHGLDSPDTVRVFANTAIAREVTHAQAVNGRFMTPLVFLQIERVDLVPGPDVCGEIREHQEGLAVAQESIYDRFRIVRARRRKESRLDE